MATKQTTRYIDCTPTWSEILPTLLILLKDGDLSGQATAHRELNRMAQLADIYVSQHSRDVAPHKAPATAGERLMPGCECGAAARGEFQSCTCD